MGSFLGIDLGTTYSAVAYIDDTGRPMIICNDQGQNITPSCVAKDGVDKIVVGEFARKTWGIDSGMAAAHFKRDMGTSKRHSIDGQEFNPTSLSTFVLTKLMKTATDQIGDISGVVVTIPANFANEAREATMAAAKAAGLGTELIINEPTAAALYYAFKSGEDLRGNYAVYDLGGGTFDVSIVSINGQDIDVVTSNGIDKLGGADFDQVLHDIVARKYRDATGEEMVLEDFSVSDAEEEKRSLSSRSSTLAKVGRQHVEISREEFEEAISALVAQAEMLCETTIDEAAKLGAGDIQGVFLAGGSTRIPLVQESVKRVFRQDPIIQVNVDEVVAMGAALYAAYKGNREDLSPVQLQAIKKIKVLESTAMCFGTVTVSEDTTRADFKLQNSIIIEKGTKIPASVTESFYTTHENQQSVDCQVTESRSHETDLRFVKVIWEGNLELPPGRPTNQEVKVSYSFDENQIMHCSFLDVESGRQTTIDLSMASAGTDIDTDEIAKFLVE
jgi:molecular chaperone DnaK